MIETIENIVVEQCPKGVTPKCPKCEKELDLIWVKSSGFGINGLTEILICPNCHCFLGYNAWKR